MPKKVGGSKPKHKPNYKWLALFLGAVALFVGVFILKESFLSSKNLISDQGFDFLSTSNGEFDPKEKSAFFEGKQIAALDKFPEYLGEAKDSTRVLGESDGSARWIEVDLSEQKIIAHDGDEIFLEAPISSGLDSKPTPTGEFTIWYKTKSQKMSGGQGRDYYYLPNVPYIMFFHNSEVSGYRGYSLHGAYWHNDFGNKRSHGCVNLPIPIAEKLFYWTQPDLVDGQNIARETADSPGTKIVIHE